MEPQIDPVTIDQFQAILSQFKNFGIGLIQPWRLYQIAILIGILGFGQLVSLLITGRMNNWMRTLEGRPKWQLRVLLLLNQRIRSIAFVIVAWTLVYIMRE
ncbi:MAG: hypothetical protein ACI932_002658, partial [Paracoccaceae bacterium]